MYRLLTYLLLLFICTANCVSPYDFDPGYTGKFLVVNGGINQLDSINKIRLTLSTAYESYSNARPVEGVDILLVNSKNESEPFYYIDEGWYYHFGQVVKVEAGESYHIEISYLSRKYKTDSQVVPHPITPDSISYISGFKDVTNRNGSVITVESIDIFINTPINVNDETSYLRWKVDESWSFVERQCGPMHIPKVCYINRELSLDEIYIYSSENVSGEYLPQNLVAEKIYPERIEFTARHYFNVVQLAIDKNAYEYWEKVVQLANPDGDIFDLPPAPLSGNVYNINDPDEVVLGYFEVASKSIARKILYRNDIDPLHVPNKEYLCSYWGGYWEVCCNCLRIEDSSLERPEYWE